MTSLPANSPPAGASSSRRGWRRDSSNGGRPVSTASSVLVFVVSGLVGLAIVALGVVYMTRKTATDEAIRDAEQLSAVVGREIVEPVLTDSLLTGDAEALAAVDQVVREHVLDGAIVRVKLWAEDGTIVYSDEPRLVGERYGLKTEDLQAFRNPNAPAEADVSDLQRPENVYERQWSKVFEVYLPINTPNGTPLLFEAYLRDESITSDSRTIWSSLLPGLLAGLVVLEVIQVPLAWSMARRLRRGQAEREELLHRALIASDRERRQVAADLHDGPVQDLVGESYRLSAIADRLAGQAVTADVAALREAAAHARGTVQSLRTMIVDLYPSNLRTEGLEAALEDLVAPLRARGTTVELEISAELNLESEVERLLYRSAREALRNVQKHSGATFVRVNVAREVAGVKLVVEDNGRGIHAALADPHRGAHHLGLDLIESLVRDAGGTFRVESAGVGTRLHLELPCP